MDRDAIPREIRRAVFVGAGHRCAISTCRAPSPLEIVHIVPWSKSHDNSFDNLICLCANCHARYDKGQDGFDRKSMEMYKQNLQRLKGLYTDFERILFEKMIHENANRVILDDFYEPFLYYSVRDGLFVKGRSISRNTVRGVLQGPFEYCLTEKGISFLESMKLGKRIENVYSV